MTDYDIIFDEYKRKERTVPQISMERIDIMRSAELSYSKELEKIKNEDLENYVKKYSKKVKGRKMLGLLFDPEHTES